MRDIRCILIILSTILLLGCANSPDKPPIHYTVEIPKIKLHLVTDRKLFDDAIARQEKRGVAGYFKSPSDIWCFGKWIENKLTIDKWWVAGHELQHVADYYDKHNLIINPDDPKARQNVR